MSSIKITNRVLLLFAFVITTILVLSVGVWHTQAQARTPIPTFGWPIGAAPVEFTQAQVNVSESRSVVRAFVATDSLSPNCLVTFEIRTSRKPAHQCSVGRESKGAIRALWSRCSFQVMFLLMTRTLLLLSRSRCTMNLLGGTPLQSCSPGSSLIPVTQTCPR